MTAATPAVHAPVRRPHPLRRPLRIPVVLLAVMVFAAGLLVGGYAAGSLAPARTRPGLGALQRIDIVGLGVLDRAQRPADLVAAPQSRAFRRDSIRRLFYLGSVASTLFAARDRAGQVCLVSTQLDGRQYAATCAGRASAERDGLRLQWSLTTWAAEQPIGDNGYLPRFVTVVWGQDDALHISVHVQGAGP